MIRVTKVFEDKPIYCEPKRTPKGELEWWSSQGHWRAKWIALPGAGDDACAIYEAKFTAPEDVSFKLHITADTDYILMIDGEMTFRGSERGSVIRSYFDTLKVSVNAGAHCLSVIVMSYGKKAPYSKIGYRHGLLIDAEGALNGALETNKNNYRVRKLELLDWVSPANGYSSAMGGEIVFDYGKYRNSQLNNPLLEPEEQGNGCSKAIVNEYSNVRLLEESSLPEMIRQEIVNLSVIFATEKLVKFFNQTDNNPDLIKQVQTGLDCGKLIVPPNSSRTIVIALDNYYTADEYLIVSGGRGGEISIGWCEGMLKQEWPPVKENRNDIYGKSMIGFTDRFITDGSAGQKFFLPHYRAGRFVVISVTSGSEELTLDKFELRENRYPIEFDGLFHCSDYRLEDLVAPCVRTLQMCMNDTYMDCPYYEQLMYIGDGRMEILTTFVISADRRLPNKAIQLFTDSRLDSGLTQSRFPCHTVQVIPPFSMIYAAAVKDYVFYTGADMTLNLLNNAQNTLNAFEQWITPDGLLSIPLNWGFVDWTKDWSTDNTRWGVPFDGRPADGDGKVSAVHNFLYAYSLVELSKAYSACGNADLSQYHQHKAEALVRRLKKAFWNDEYGAFADTMDFTHYSEHTQCLALLTGCLSQEEQSSVADFLFDCESVPQTKCTIYFNFYYFEACRIAKRVDKIFERMQLWFDLSNLGLKTLLERPEPSRSDCHAWSSHPLFHYYSTILGIRPTSRGFKTVEIAPLVGELEYIEATMPHPAGQIKVDLHFANGLAHGTIALPTSITGAFKLNAQELNLKPGINQI